MVTRKYLCSAPHTSTWDDKASALLKSLGGSRKKREKLLKQTLSALQEIIGETKRTGPGRKSNAEHAINFYEYVLELNEEEEDDDGEPSTKKARIDDDDDDESMGSQSFLDQHNDLCELCNEGGDLLCCSTCNLVFHLGCTRPKLMKVPSNDNWSCSYCIASGSTGHKREARTRRRAAAAVRLMNRLCKDGRRGGKREDGDEESDDEEEGEEGNEEEEEQDDDVEEDEQDEEEEIKEEDKEEIKEEGKEEVKKEKPAASDEKVESNEKSENDEDVDGIGSSNATKSKQDAMDDSESADDGEDTNAEDKRARRCRRQPILYNPQDCPASEWQSDGVLEWKTLSLPEKGVSDSADESNEEADDDKDEKEAKKKDASTEEEDDEEEDEEANDEPIWCKFCQDDPSIPVCCFCACRVCFGKHDGSKLLLCDQCDDEYHTYCLTPPLSKMPAASQKWFCPGCKSSKGKSGTVSTRAKNAPPVTPKKLSVSQSVEKRRGPGRPPNTERSKGGKTPSTEKRRVGRPSLSDRQSQSSEKRPRGRPPSSARGRSGKQGSPTDVMRRRGRPSTKKTTTGKSGSVARQSDAGERRGSGRPRKSVSPSASSEDVAAPRKHRPTKRPRSPGDAAKGTRASPRTSKADGEDDMPETSDDEVADSEKAEGDEIPSSARPVQRSRSGRMLKRSAFHDEIDEGEQHLRSAKGLAMFPGNATAPSPQPNDVLSLTALLPVLAQNEVAEDYVAPTPTVAPAIPPVFAEVAKQAVSAASVPPSSQIKVVEPPAPLPQQLPVQQATINIPKQPAPVSSPAPTKVVVPASIPSLPVPPLPPTKAVSPVVPPAPVIPPPAPPPSAIPKPQSDKVESPHASTKVPRRKPGARECMQISRRFGAQVIPQKYMDTLMDYCSRGKVEHLIRMRERLDDHSRFLEAQLAGLEALVKEKGEIDAVVPPMEQEERPMRSSPTMLRASPPTIGASPPMVATTVKAAQPPKTVQSPPPVPPPVSPPARPSIPPPVTQLPKSAVQSQPGKPPVAASVPSMSQAKPVASATKAVVVPAAPPVQVVAREMADGMTTFEPYEPRTESPERSLLDSRSQLSSLRASNITNQNMNRSVEDLDGRISSVKLSPHDAEQFSALASDMPTIAKYYSWDLEHKRWATVQSPLFVEISSGPSGFGVPRVSSDRLVENIHLASRKTGSHLTQIEEDHEEGGVGVHNHRGILSFNEYGRLRIHAKLQPLRNLIGDKSVIHGDSWKETAREAFLSIDTNKDGFLSRLEIITAVKLMSDINHDFGTSVDPNSEDLTQRLLDWTCNGSEKLDVDEFMDLVEAEVRSGRNIIRTHFVRASKLFHDWLLSDRQQLGTNSAGDSCWMIHPTSVLNLFWHISITAASVALVFFLPISFGWEDWKNVDECNYVFEIIFMLDVAAKLVTGYIGLDGKVIMDRGEARRHYLHSFAFKLDLLSSLPINFVLLIWGATSGPLLYVRTPLKCIKMLQVAKLFRIRRTDPLHALTKRLSSFLDTSYKLKFPIIAIKLLRLVFLTFVLSHWMGAFQWWHVRANDFPEDSWAVKAGLQDVPHNMQWSYALFKALAQLILIGFEAPPFTNTSCLTLSNWCQKEHWTTLLCLYIGAIYYSFLISSMLSIIQANNMASTSYQERLTRLNDYLTHKDVPMELKDQIREQFRMNNPSRVYYDESEVSKSLSVQHIEAIRRHGVGDLISLVPILAHPANKEFAHCLTGHLSKVELDNEQILFNEGDIGDAMYFLHTGYIRLIASFFEEKDDRHSILASGCFFGEVSLLTTNTARTMTAMGEGRCVLFRLERSTFRQLIYMFPNAAARIKHAASFRLQTLMRFKNDVASLPMIGCGVTAPVSAYYDPEDRLVPSLQKPKGAKAESKTNEEDETAAAMSEADLSDRAEDIESISV